MVAGCSEVCYVSSRSRGRPVRAVLRCRSKSREDLAAVVCLPLPPVPSRPSHLVSMVPFPAPSPRPLLSVNTQSTSNPFDAPHLQQSLTTSPSLSSSLYPSALSFTSSSRSDAGAGQEGSSPTSSCQRIYSQLAVVKKLQEDMARSHALLEGIGRGSDWVWAAGAGGGSGDGGVNSEAGTDGKGSAKGKERSTGESEGGRSREKERRGLAYEDMKGEFQDRQGGVDVIMSKVSPELSFEMICVILY